MRTKKSKIGNKKYLQHIKYEKMENISYKAKIKYQRPWIN